jgi:hypothetical protein
MKTQTQRSSAVIRYSIHILVMASANELSIIYDLPSRLSDVFSPLLK